jgi:hypothetical protein
MFLRRTAAIAALSVMALLGSVNGQGTMKVLITAVDFEGLPFAPNHPTGWGTPEGGAEVLFAGQPASIFYWGQGRCADTSIAHGGHRAWRGYGLEWGMGMMVMTDPETKPNTKYQAEFWIKDECPVDGRMFLEFAENDVGGKGSGEVRRSWPTSWVKDSISWTTPSSIGQFNALLLNIATLGVGQGMATASSYGYIDDVLFYKVVPTSSAPPVVKYQPVAATTTLGKRAVFSVGVTGALPMTFQWYRNGEAVSGATSRSYWVENPTASDAGARYTVKVTNKDGEVTSNEVTLTIPGIVVSASNGAAVRTRDVVPCARIQGSDAVVMLPEAGSWMLELRSMDGRLVGAASGTGAEARVSLPAAGTACVARMTSGGKTVVLPMVPALAQ